MMNNSELCLGKLMTTVCFDFLLDFVNFFLFKKINKKIIVIIISMFHGSKVFFVLNHSLIRQWGSTCLTLFDEF